MFSQELCFLKHVGSCIIVASLGTVKLCANGFALTHRYKYIIIYIL